MQSITFITGNQKKADNLARLIGMPVEHIKLDLDEIQSLNLREVVEHKARQAYAKVQKPIIVEDVALEFEALGRLPGTFIKFFEKEIGHDKLCRLIDMQPRSAIARCTFGYFDWVDLVFFEWSIAWTIAQNPKWDNGFWWDRIFIPYFTDKTSAELDEASYNRFYTEEKPIHQVREFLLSR